MPIRRLSVQLANQIAAGEVVERPASVVKELLENAIDAGSSEITLEIRAAGKMLVRVTDNGSGIPKDELPLAIAQHATSKISCQNDLDAIRTLGFRGEALASIASVSKFKLISCTKDQDKAYKIVAEGLTKAPTISPAAHPLGTSVFVEELFFNTPARRRFLKADKTEFNHIKDLFIRLALVNPEIGFRFVSEGKTIYQLPRTTYPEIGRRLAKLLGNEYEKEGVFFDNASPDFKRWAEQAAINSRQDFAQVLHIKGVILPQASLSKPMPERLLTFLNKRVISDRVVNHALRDAYAAALLDRHDSFKPALRAVFFMDCDPYEIDVNVHPRKDEVRFHNVQAVHESITDTLNIVMHHLGMNRQRGNQSFLGIEKKAIEAAQAAGEAIPVFQPAPEVKPQVVTPLERRHQIISLEEERRAEINVQAHFAKIPAVPLQPLPESTQAPSLPGRICNLFALRSEQDEMTARLEAVKVAPFMFHKRENGAIVREYQADKLLVQQSVQEQQSAGQQNILSPLQETAFVSKEETVQLVPQKQSSHFVRGESKAQEMILGLSQEEESELFAQMDQVLAKEPIISSVGGEKELPQEAVATPVVPAKPLTATEALFGAGAVSSGVFSVATAAPIAENSVEERLGPPDIPPYDIVDMPVPDSAQQEPSVDLDRADDELSAIPEWVKADDEQPQPLPQPNSRPVLSQAYVERQDPLQAALAQAQEEQSASVAAPVKAPVVASEPAQDTEPMGALSQAVPESLSESQESVSSSELAGDSATGAEAAADTQGQIRIEGSSEGDNFYFTSETSAQVCSSFTRKSIAVDILKEFPDAPDSEFLALVAPDVVLFRLGHKYYLGRGVALHSALSANMYQHQALQQQVRPYDLSIAFAIKAEPELLEAYQQAEVVEMALRFGFSVKPHKARACLELQTIPPMMRCSNLAEIALPALQIIAYMSHCPLEAERLQCSTQVAQIVAKAQLFSIADEVDAKLLVSKIASLQQLEGITYPQELRELKLFELAQSMSKF